MQLITIIFPAYMRKSIYAARVCVLLCVTEESFPIVF